MRIDVATEYMSSAIQLAVDQAFFDIIEEYGLSEGEADAVVEMLGDATYTVDFGDGEEREL